MSWLSLVGDLRSTAGLVEEMILGFRDQEGEDRTREEGAARYSYPCQPTARPRGSVAVERLKEKQQRSSDGRAYPRP